MTQGILTATDRTMFDGLIWWHRAVRQTGYAALCIDLGITQHQREISALEQIPLVSPPTWVPQFDREQFKWIKPFLVAASPFDQTLWVDVDALVIRSPKAIFDAITQGPVVMSDPCGNHLCANKPELYNLCPVASTDAYETGCNSGVVGVQKGRDNALLAAWCDLVTQASFNPVLRSLIAYEDQGALVWAMLKTGNCITLRDSWNYPADGLVSHLPRRHKRPNNAGFLDDVRAYHWQATVVHWLSKPKFWETWEKILK